MSHVIVKPMYLLHIKGHNIVPLCYSMYIHTYIHVHVHIYAHACTYIHTYIHTVYIHHMYMYIHTMYIHTYSTYHIAGYIGGNNVWRIARKRKKIAIGGYKFGGYGMIATPSLGVYVVGAILVDLTLVV